MSEKLQRPWEYTALLIEIKKELEECAWVSPEAINELIRTGDLKNNNLSEKELREIIRWLPAYTDLTRYLLKGIEMPISSIEYVNSQRPKSEERNRRIIELLGPTIKSYSDKLSRKLIERIWEVINMN